MPTAMTPTTMYSAIWVSLPLQSVRGAHVQEAQPQEHERYSVEDDVHHAGQLPPSLAEPCPTAFTTKAA